MSIRIANSFINCKDRTNC